MQKIDCICCGELYYTSQLDENGICAGCNTEETCDGCDLAVDDCVCSEWGFYDEDFDEDGFEDELMDWEGEDYEDDDYEDDDDDDW